MSTIRTGSLTGACFAAMGFLGCGGKSANPSQASGFETSSQSASSGRATSGSGSAIDTSGSATGSTGSQIGPSGNPGGTGCSSGAPTPEHRPIAVACQPTLLASGSGAPDAGGVSCMTDAECQSDSGNQVFPWCRNGTCSADQCTSDGDCAAGEACGCQNQFEGYALHGNTCVPTSCLVDADCGVNGLCSPRITTMSLFCATFEGYGCRSAADTCETALDCGPNAGCPSGATDSDAWDCVYQPAVTHWACTDILGMAPCPM